MTSKKFNYTKEYETEGEFEKLVEPILTDVYRFIFSIVKDKFLADDILQNTLIKAYINLHKLKSKRKFKSWIFSVGRNEALDYYEKNNKNLETLFKNSVIDKLYTSNEDIEHMVIKNETIRQLIKEVYLLKEIYREVIFLHYYYGFSLEEISRILQISSSIVRTRHGRAKIILSSRLQNIKE